MIVTEIEFIETLKTIFQLCFAVATPAIFFVTFLRA